MAVKGSAQLTLVDLTDAYTVFMTNESHTFIGDTDSVASTQSTTTQFVAYLGNEQVPVKVGPITGATGISATSDGKTPSPTVTITATTALKTGGTLSIPLTINDTVTITKKFSYAIAFKGTSGTGVNPATTTYQLGTSATTPPTGTWSSSPSYSKGMYLWTRVVTPYTDGSSSTSYSVSYCAKDGAPGKDGDPGADAITLVVTSSAGTIFKNADISTTLTAHVYKAGAEVTGTALSNLGTIKWYKDGSTTAVATGTTLTINAGDVSNKASYVAQLEG